jgi:hypothetical protein
MANQQLGQTIEARAARAKANETAGTNLPKLDSGDLGGLWNYVFIANILLREAKALIEQPPAGTNSPLGSAVLPNSR